MSMVSVNVIAFMCVDDKEATDKQILNMINLILFLAIVIKPNIRLYLAMFSLYIKKKR